MRSRPASARFGEHSRDGQRIAARHRHMRFDADGLPSLDRVRILRRRRRLNGDAKMIVEDLEPSGVLVAGRALADDGDSLQHLEVVDEIFRG